jgi:hypothetical protein
MEPRTYCEGALTALRNGDPDRFNDAHSNQVQVVLLHFAQQPPTARAFPDQLKLMATSAVRMQRVQLAAAAEAILQDWREAEAQERG